MQQLVLVFIVAVLLRLPTVGSKSMWLDEAFGAYHAQRAELATPTVVEGTHPPLYYTFLHYWIPVAGNGEVGLRLPSVAVSLAGIGLLYLLARMLFDRHVALVAATLLAVSPLDVWYAQEARMYIFVTFFGLLFALALLWSRPLSVLIIAAAAGVGLYFDILCFHYGPV
ncbi:MAG: glycosyltransferase family 39 protein [Anaerolineae bacterium]|nr:glycosyltransferase family 39 protein [Anaerolineae bacterium]